MVATIAEQPFTVANIPVSSWSFAIRIWLATILALFVSFWLQLEAPTTAALTVGIVAEPTRGQALDKAGFRLLATVVGVTASNKAVLQQRMADLNVKDLQSDRRRRLLDPASSPEEKQVYEGNALQAKAAVDSAQEQIAQAEINLHRTEVRGPVNGIVTNLLLREGDYAHQGATNVSIIDTDSYWVDGYFEETKLVRMYVGDRAEAKLMGYSAPIMGHIATVTRGVSV